MIGVALKGLLGRKTRAVLTALAIILGVAMVSGTFVLTDTIERAFKDVFTKSFDNTSVIISGKEIVKGAANGNATVPDSLLPKVRALPDVEAASGGFLFVDIKLIDAQGKKIGGKGGAPSLGFGVDPKESRFNPLALTAGKWASAADEVVIDSATASKKHYAIGATIGAKADGPVEKYKVVGIATINGVSIGGATLAAFDVPTAQAILNKPGQLDGISVAAKPGVSEAKLADEIRPVLPSTVRVRTSAEETKKATEEISQGINIIRVFLLTFGGIALFVGAFVIFNTISITVAQRAREFATLRTLGASRRQVLRSVLVESLVIGVLASLLGLFLGVGLAKGLNAVFKALGADLPQAGTVFATRTILISILVGTIVTLLASLSPAIRATRVPPIAAVREGAVLPPPRHARLRPFIVVVVVVLGLLALGDGLFVASGATSVLIPLGFGTLLLFVGVAMVSKNLVRPLAAFVGAPARRLGGTAGRLAADNSVRNPGRTATTAAALMIGLALVTFVATLGAGLRSSIRDAADRQVTADYVASLSGDSDQPLFPRAAGDALAAAPGVEVASSVRSDKAKILGNDEQVNGIDGATIGSVYHFDWKQGSDNLLPLLGGDGAIVDDNYAEEHDLSVGSKFDLQASDGSKAPFVVRGIYDPPRADQLFFGILISQFAFDGAFPSPKNSFTFVDVNGGANPATTASLERALSGFTDAKIETKSGFVKSREADINTTLMLFYVLLALSVIVSLFGMVNTLILSVFERTRELGMLRAIGMTRIQVRRMVRQESVITALIGAALGLPLGIFLAALVTQGLSSEGVGFHLPIFSLIVFALVSGVAGVLAAVVPARRAARLNVLEALQYE